MQSFIESLPIGAAGGLVVGLLLGFLPAHSANTRLQDQDASLAHAEGSTQEQLNVSQRRLHLSNLAVQSSEVSSQVQSNNYSVASASASSLFTNLRKYVDTDQDNETTQQMKEILSDRDRVIAGLAQANPAVKPLLQQIFTKLETVSATANQSN